jgi:S-adenosylmethionine decarboxylase proenzyme
MNTLPIIPPDPPIVSTPCPPGFEGAEKKLEIDFLPVVDLRLMSLQAIDSILSAARCTRINKTSNAHFDCYVLSESSLFVFPHKIMIKTCGTTSLLQSLPKMLEATRAMGTKPEFVQYSRTQFKFPDRQPEIHRSFDGEVDFLNAYFRVGHGHIFGPINGPRWHLYVADLVGGKGSDNREQTLEIVMTELDQRKMRQFFKSKPETPIIDGVVLPHDGKEATTLSGIDRILPGAEIDDFLFEPCGYSCNALLDESFFTIHITPEAHCSFVSFETNARLHEDEYDGLVNRVLDTFRPARFTVSLFVDESSRTRRAQRALTLDHKGFATKTCAFQQFEGPYNVCVAHLALVKPLDDEQKLSDDMKIARADDFEVAEQRSSSGSDSDQEVLSYSAAAALTPKELLECASRAVQSRFPLDRVSPGDLKQPVAVIREMISKDPPTNSFYLVNVAELVQRFYRWSVAYPGVEPFYTVKCNSHPGVLLALNTLGCGFICSTVFEIKLLLSLGVLPKRIVFSNPWKSESHIRFCHNAGVRLLACSDSAELAKIAKHGPRSKLIIHINSGLPNAKTTPVVDHVFIPGASVEKAKDLITEAKKANLRVVGCSFDIGETCYDVQQFKHALKDAQQVFFAARSILGYDLRILDIGGGFPDGALEDRISKLQAVPSSMSSSGDDSKCLPSFDRLAARLNHLIPKYFSQKVRCIAHPTRFLATSSHYLAVSVVDRRNALSPRSSASESADGYTYYINDGLYGSFNCLMRDNKQVHPLIVTRPENSDFFPSRIFGASGSDCVLEHEQLPLLEVGDWLCFPNMGSYALCSAYNANGLKTPEVRFVAPA